MNHEELLRCEAGIVAIGLAAPQAIDDYELDLAAHKWIDTDMGKAWRVLVAARHDGVPFGDTAILLRRLKAADVPGDAIAKAFDGFQPHGDYYVETMRENDRIERLRSMVGTLSTKLDANNTAAELVDWINREVGRFDIGGDDNTETHVGHFMEQAANLSMGSGQVVRKVQSGLPNLDKVIGGFYDGQLTVLAARPSVGKSAFAAQMAVTVAKEGLRTVFVSLEMSALETTARCIAHETGLAMREIINGNLTSSDTEHVRRLAKHYIDSIPFHVEDRASVTMPKLARIIRQHASKERVGLLVVDYVGLIAGNGRQSETEIITQASKQLKLIAREEKLPILLLSQLNRESEKDQQMKAPLISQLRQSGSLEQDADNVLLLHRESRTAKTATLIVAKNRNGPVAKVTLEYVGPKYEFLPSLETQSEYAGDF